MRTTHTPAWAALAVLALVAASPAPAAPPPHAVPPDGPTGDLRLRDALARALRGHPALTAHSCEVQARDAEVRHAGRRPNPELELEVENLAGTGAFAGLDGAEATLSVTQALELGGKRAARVRSARLDRDLAARTLELRRLDVAAETAVRFAEVLAAQRRLAVADTLLAVAEQVLESVARRVEAGGISPVEEYRARAALETDRVDRDRAARELDAARIRLAAAWGGPAPAFARAVGDLDRLVSVPALDDLRSRLAGSPHLLRWDAELDRRRAERDGLRAVGVPDLEVSAGVRRFRDEGETALRVGIAAPLPLFHRSRDAARAAEARIARGRAERRETEVRLSAELAAAHAALATTAAEATALRERILPPSAAALAEAEDAYRRGRLRLTDVLDAKRTHFRLRERQVDVLAQHHAAAARLERLLGAPLHDPPREEG